MAKQKRIKVKLPEGSLLNKEIVKELDYLIGYSSPTELKECLVDLLLEYCLALEDVPLNYKRNIECLWGLIHFLNATEKEIQQKK